MIQTRWYVNRSWEERKRNAKETRPRKRITEETRRPDTWCCIEIVSVVVNDLWNVEFITVQLTMLSDECSQVSSASCSFTEMIRSYCGQAWRSMVGPDVLRELSSIQWVCDGTFGVVTLCALRAHETIGCFKFSQMVILQMFEERNKRSPSSPSVLWTTAFLSRTAVFFGGNRPWCSAA
jgi:hypothetical protein